MKTWDLGGKPVWVLLSSWDKNPVYTPGVHKRHKAHAVKPEKGLYGAWIPSSDSDFVL